MQKNTLLPNRTTVASNSLVNKTYDIPEASIIAGQPAKLVKTGIYRDMKDNKIKLSKVFNVAIEEILIFEQV